MKFSECVLWTMAKKLMYQNFDLGPQNFTKNFQKLSKMLKILNFFIFWARTFKFSECVLQIKTKISVEPEFWFRAPKFFKKFSKMAKVLKFFIFRARTFKFWDYIDFGILISYLLEFFGLEPPFLPHGPPKFKKVKFSISTQNLQNWWWNF